MGVVGILEYRRWWGLFLGGEKVRESGLVAHGGGVALLLQGFLADTMQQPPKTCCCLISSCHSSLFRHYKDLLAGDSSPEICFLRILARQSSPNSPSQTLPSTHAHLDIHISAFVLSSITSGHMLLGFLVTGCLAYPINCE